MKVQNLNSQNFKAEKYRINNTYLNPSGIYTPSPYEAEFDDYERAHTWFIKSQRAKTREECAYCIKQMGEYKLINIEAEKEINKTINKRNIFVKLKDFFRKLKVK